MDRLKIDRSTNKNGYNCFHYQLKFDNDKHRNNNSKRQVGWNDGWTIGNTTKHHEAIKKIHTSIYDLNVLHIPQCSLKNVLSSISIIISLTNSVFEMMPFSEYYSVRYDLKIIWLITFRVSNHLWPLDQMNLINQPFSCVTIDNW